MDFFWVILFIFWCEVLSLPLRWSIAGWRAPADVRRMASRLAGPPLLALPVWFLAHGGRGLLERGPGLAWVGLAAALGLLAGLKQTRSAARLMAYERIADCARDYTRERIADWVKQAGLDGLMIVLLLGFTAFRRWVPEMTTYQLDGSGAEKFANAMIFWSNWHARQMPPEDYWLAGTPLPYYYWGHFEWAWVARLGGFPAGLALNLALGAMVTLTWTAGYLLARAARLPRAWAAGAALCVAWAGNPEAIRQATPMLVEHGFKSPETFWGWVAAAPDWFASYLKMVLTTPPARWGYYDYWAPSRAIAGNNVVDEFPAFSAILGDFHSHHLALPWLTGWLALAVAGGRWRGGNRGEEVCGKRDSGTAESRPGSNRESRSRAKARLYEKNEKVPAHPPAEAGGKDEPAGSRLKQDDVTGESEHGSGGEWRERVTEKDRLRARLRARILICGLSWGLAWGAMGVGAVLTNLWNLPLVGLGVAVMLLLAAWRWGRGRQGWRGMALEFVYAGLFGAALWSGMQLLRSGAPLPLPKAEGESGGMLSRLPIRKLPPELRTALGNLFGMWGLPVLALALAAAGSLAPRRRRRRRREKMNSFTGEIIKKAHPEEGIKKVGRRSAKTTGKEGKPGRESRERERGRSGQGEAGSDQKFDPSGVGKRPGTDPGFREYAPPGAIEKFDPVRGREEGTGAAKGKAART